MCKGKSFIVTKNEVYESSKSNSHEDIKTEFKLKDTNTENLLIAEAYPRGKNLISFRQEDWEISFENSPNWFNKEEDTDRIYKVLFDRVLPRWKIDGITEGLDLSGLNYKKLPDFKKIKVGGYFSCYNNQLTTLQGAPAKVGGSFYCYNNQLTTLQGAPAKVGGYFYCYNNQLTTLQGAPAKVGGSFSCDNNQLTTLQGAPAKVGGGFYCHNNQLTTLQGAPAKVGGYFSCGSNPSLKENYQDYIKRIKKV